MNQQKQIVAATLLIFLSRLPFLSDGFGSEEDAWALRLVAENIASTGIYEVSRLPGHPLQELLFASIWNAGSFVWNLITAFISTVGIYFFMKSLSRLQIPGAVISGFILAAVPIVYINSTNSMDYTWAMSFTLIAFYFLTGRQWMYAGIMLALATGCRITSAAFALPAVYYIFNSGASDRWMSILKFAISASICTLIIFIPVFNNYGLSFFTFYEHFPIPGFAKNFYKGVIAVWGLPLLIAIPLLIISQLKTRVILNNKSRQLLVFCGIYILLVILMFIRVPLKAAFMIPLVPFAVIPASLYFSEGRMKLLLLATLASAFLFGVNLNDPLRGSSSSSFSVKLNISGQPVSIDALQGLVSADRTKRIQRTTYANKVIFASAEIRKPAAVIAGWWLADILVLEKERTNSGVKWLYYADQQELLKLSAEGYHLYYLPEQNAFNDLRFKKVFTDSLAKPFPLLP